MNKCLFGKEQEIDAYLVKNKKLMHIWKKGRVNENCYFKNVGL